MTITTTDAFTYLHKETFSCGGQRHTVEIYRHEKTGLEFVLVPGGSFEMGSNSGEDGRYGDEAPVHRVTVRPFLLCRTQCTQEAWDRVGGFDDREWRGIDLPIESVNWENVTDWCRKAELRLPSEAEWEYACRAGTTTRFCFGDSISDLRNYAWYKENSDGRTHPVDKKKPNAFGLYDMHGNVWELCEDVWHDNYNSAPMDGSAWTSGSSSFRTKRGGCWSSDHRFCRSAIRDRCNPDNRWYNLGFRPACSIKEES